MKFIFFALDALSATCMFLSRVSSTVDYDTLRLRELVDELTQRYPDYLDNTADSEQDVAGRDLVERQTPVAPSEPLAHLSTSIDCGEKPKTIFHQAIEISLDKKAKQAWRTTKKQAKRGKIKANGFLFPGACPVERRKPMQLLFNGKECDSEAMLKDCGIVEGSHIDFVAE